MARSGLGSGLGTLAGTGLGFLVPGIGPMIGGTVGGLIGGGAQSLANRGQGTPQNPQLMNTMGGVPQGSLLGGTPAYERQFQKFTPDQQSALNQTLSQALSMLGNQKQFDFGPIEEQARKGFAERTIPSIAERFTSMGAQRSSAFPQLLGQAGSDLESQLAAMKSQYGLQGQQQQNQLMAALLGQGLTPQFETGYFERQPGLAESASKNFLQYLPQLLAMLGQGYMDYKGNTQLTSALQGLGGGQ